MKINLFTIRNLLLVILAAFCTNVFAADRPKDDLWKLAQKLLDKRIRQNTLLIAQGRQDEANYVIDMHKLLLGDSKRFISATSESTLQRELGDVFLGGNKTDVAGRIQPYLIIMLPAFQEAEYLEQGDEVQPLKVDSSSYTLGLRTTHQNSLIATLVITGYIRVTPDPPRGVYTPVASATYALNQRLGFDMFTRWSSVPSTTRQETTDAFVTEATTRFITILEGPPTVPPSPFEITCDVTIEQLTTQTQAIREAEYESAITGFKELLQNTSRKVNGSDYMFADQDLAFIKDNVFTGQVIPDKLATLADDNHNYSDYKMYVVYKQVNFAMSSTDWITFAQSVYDASALAGGNNILLIVPYKMIDIGCSRTSRWLGERVNEKTAITMPVVYCANANLKNAMNLALGTATEWKDGFLNAFTKVPKDHIVYSYYFRVDGKVLNVVTRSERQATNASIVEFNFWYDKEALEGLCGSSYNPNTAGRNGVANYLVSSRQNFQQEIRRLLQNPNPQLHEHNLKEQYIEAEHKRYIDWYLHTKYTDYFDTRGVYPRAPSIAFFEERQDPVLIAIDLASIGLSFWGLDGIADAAGSMYCTYKGDYVNAAIYGASVTVVFVSAVIVKNFINGADVAMDGERAVIIKSLEESAAATARWASKGYNKIEEWLAAIDNADVKSRIESILAQWDNTQDAAVLTKIDNVLGDPKYFGIADEFVNTPELLIYLQRAEQHEWAKFGLAAIIKRDPAGTVHPVKNSPKFSEVINDYEVPENSINRRLSDLEYFDETRPGDLGNLFDDWMGRTIGEAWRTNDFSRLPSSVASRLQSLKNDYVMIQQAKISKDGFRPVPDMLFVRKTRIGNLEDLDFTQCIYIDNKILWDTKFSETQLKITDNVTANSGVTVRYTETTTIDVVFTIPRNAQLTIVKVETFSVDQAIELVNLPKRP